MTDYKVKKVIAMSRPTSSAREEWNFASNEARKTILSNAGLGRYRPMSGATPLEKVRVEPVDRCNLRWNQLTEYERLRLEEMW